jgi:Tol biopolymer transport system component/DNA-binding winged helix-turn-helix (wHTH) protein
MPETPSQSRVVRFGAFEADLRTEELRKAGVKLKFSGQPFQVLAILLERPGEVVTREELQKRLWPDTFVDVERNLNTAVNKIREVLGDSAENPRFVETLARRGYRFIAELEVPIQPAVSAVTVNEAPSPALPRPIWRRMLPWAAMFLAGTLLAGIAFLVFALRRPHPPGMHFRAVTNFSGVQSHPALSPDGRSVAFVSNRDGDYNIYVGLLNGANPVKITDNSYLKSTPCWSPDGTEIAYARLNDSGIWDIWRVPALGGTSRRFVLNASDPAWSRDGRWLAYRKSSTGAIWISDAAGQNGRELARAQNGLFGNSGPRFSPNGREVAYAISLGGPTGELEIVDIESGKVRRLTHDAALVLSPAWSADGQSIYFASSRGGTPNIWKIAERGGEPQQITTGQGDDVQLDISADGKRIVFSTFRSNVNLAELDLGPGGQKNPRLLISDLARSQNGPDYSPDGKHIAYFSVLKGVENEGIWLANSDGSDPVPLVQDRVKSIFPHWTTDSASLVYVTMPGPFDFRRISISGGTPQTLQRNVPDYLPDIDSGGQLLFEGSHGEVQIANSGKVQTLVTLPSDMNPFLFRWSPDHQTIAFAATPTQEGDPHAGVWVFDRNESPRQIFRGWVTWYAWGPGNEIYFVQAKPDQQGVLWKVDRSGSGLTQVPVTIPLPFDYWYVEPMTQFDISPDGRHLAFTFQQVLQANIGLLENVQ